MDEVWTQKQKLNLNEVEDFFKRNCGDEQQIQNLKVICLMLDGNLIFQREHHWVECAKVYTAFCVFNDFQNLFRLWEILIDRIHVEIEGFLKLINKIFQIKLILW